MSVEDPAFLFTYDQMKHFVALCTVIYNYEDNRFISSSAEHVQETYDYIKDIYEITLFIDIEKTSFQGFVCVNKEENEICVIFRGSEDLKDFAHDACIFQVPYGNSNNIKVHGGFKHQLESSNADKKLIDEIKRLLLLYPNFNIYVSGHSLAGALSILFGYQLSFELESHNINVLSIATPRVGNYAFKKSFHTRQNLHHVRLVNSGDIVTAFPNLFYYHVGNVVKINSKGETLFLESDKYCICEFTIWNNFSISSHYLESYWRNINKVNKLELCM